MFETADEIMRRRGLVSYPSHVVSWGWEGFSPGLETFDLRKGQLDEPLGFRPGDVLDMAVSPHRRCVGSFTKEGYRPCMMRREVSGQFDQCRECASTWIPRQECIFEPACDGVHDVPCGTGGSICAQPHHVYAAFYGDLVKVGMTLSSRLLERGIEQGADAIVMLGTYGSRKAAREAENMISKALKATQWVRRNTFLKCQVKKVDREMYQQMLETSLSLLDEGVVTPSSILMLDRYPLEPADLARATFVEVPGRHRGKVLGCKGKFLFYLLRDGGVRLLDMSSLPSRYIALDQANHNKA